MCQVSNKIIFCSCATKSVRNLKQYWVWHQYNKEKNIMIVGEIYIPDFRIDKHKKINKITILKRLTETDAFDKILDFKNKDILEIVFNDTPNNDPITYCFQFKNGSWKNKEYHPFELESQYDERDFGKFQFPLKKQK